MNTMHAKLKGLHFEALACSWLKKQGLQLLSRNYLCRYGEIDLVMIDRKSLVFVEVRYRDHQGWGNALESIDQRKQRRLRLTASHYLLQHAQWRNHACRFDVLGIHKDNTGRYHYDWIANAFI
jgi:putative endonuclease